MNANRTEKVMAVVLVVFISAFVIGMSLWVYLERGS